METAKANLLEAFYEHVDEDDWLEGLDLYQAGKVSQVQIFNGGLITGRVAAMGAASEVRLKIHPNGHCIQWIECTCRKNRTTGRYCEHLASFMIHLDRENPRLLGNLDSKMPLKPPTSMKKRGLKAEKKEVSPDDKEGAAQTILTHLQGSIHSVSLMASGPTLRVRLEIRPGQLTHYNLDLDAAAKFLETHPNLKTASDEVKALKVYNTQVLRGTRIYQLEDEKLVAERVVAIPHIGRKKNIETDPELEAVIAPHKQFSHVDPEGKKGVWEFIPLKASARYIGKEYFFLPGRGFWPLQKDDHHSDWNELPLKKIYKEDQAGALIATQFAEYTAASTIWLDENLEDPVIHEAPKLEEIKIFKADDGWFYLDPTYGSGGSAVSMVELMRQFRKKRRNYMKTGKSWLKIPDFIKEHDWQLDETGQYLKVDTIGLMRMKAAVGDFDNFAGSKKVLNQIRNRLEFTPVDELPSLNHTKLNLREYQTKGFEWMWWLYQNNLHGLLADEMGLGKTHQAMALLSAIQTKKKTPKFLVIAPTTVLDHWLDKMVDFCPNLKPFKHHGPKRFLDFGSFESDHVTMITSYGVLLRDIKALGRIHWDAVILDEAHFVKNNDTATYRAVCRLTSSIRICLTGTPMENHLGELKNIFDFLVPGYLGSNEFFKKNYLSPIEGGSSPETELALQKLIHPFKMRRIKEHVLKDLPAKVEDVRHCGLSDEQVKSYKEVVALKATPLLRQLQDENSPIPFLHVFATLTMLKQICNHPALVLDNVDWRQHTSGKFELFKEIVEEAIGSGHKIVVYSQYVSMIKIFEEYLKEQKIEHVVLTGQTRNRGKVINEFQTNPNCKIFCGSLLAGGVGIDLTAASVVIHYDRWWNASKENQATDRVHRIGQHNNVQVLKLITRGTLEEKIDELIKSKREVFEKFMDQDEEVFKTFDRQQLIELLQ